MSMARSSSLLVAFSAIFFLSLSAAFAHQTEQAEQASEVRPETGEVEQLFSISAEDLAHHLGAVEHGEEPSSQILRELRDEIGDYIDEHTAVIADDEHCELIETDFVGLPAADGRVHYHQKWQCPPRPREVAFENRIMIDSAGGYRHMGRIQVGEAIHPTVFDTRFPTYAVYPDIDEEPSQAESAQPRFVWQGLLHILFGFDHILFILALLFAVRRFWSLVVVVTAFTVGHSLTLALSALDIWTISPRIIEPLIALSILYVAAKNIVSGGDWRHVWSLALAFGLIHGFGFSYILRGDLPLPADQAIWALLAFNLGVEIGHLAVVAVAFPLVYWLRSNKEKLFSGVNRWINAAIVGAALYWMIDRIFFW